MTHAGRRIFNIHDCLKVCLTKRVSDGRRAAQWWQDIVARGPIGVRRGRPDDRNPACWPSLGQRNCDDKISQIILRQRRAEQRALLYQNTINRGDLAVSDRMIRAAEHLRGHRRRGAQR